MAVAATDPLSMSLQNSTIALRAPYTSTAAPNMVDSLPSLNFGFDDLRARMNAFTVRFDDFIERGRKRVLEERNQFRMSLADVHDKKFVKDRAITQLEQESERHAQAVTAQGAEMDEMQAAIGSLTATRDNRAEQLSKLKEKASQARTEINQRKEENKKQDQWLKGMRRLDVEEVSFWEDTLGLRVEAAGNTLGHERVRFILLGLHSGRVRSEQTEAWFELDMSHASSTKGFEVVESRPRIESSQVESLVREMNEIEDLARFLKGMRDLLKQATK